MSVKVGHFKCHIQLGHGSISTTLGMYTHPDAQGIRNDGNLARDAVAQVRNRSGAPR